MDSYNHLLPKITIYYLGLGQLVDGFPTVLPAKKIERERLQSMDLW